MRDNLYRGKNQDPQHWSTVLHGWGFFGNLCISVYYIKTIAHTHKARYTKFHNMRVLTKNTFSSHHSNKAILRDPRRGKNRDIKNFLRGPIHTGVSPLFTGYQVMRVMGFPHIYRDYLVLDMNIGNNTQYSDTVKP